MINTVIFDIGNVLTDYTWKEFFAKFDFTEEVRERLYQATVLNEDWNQLDFGILSTEQIVGLFQENDPGIAKEIEQTMADLNGLVTRRDYAIPWIEELKEQGIKVLVLSNFSEKAVEDCGDALDFLPYVDGGILSYREKVIKPMPEIYQRLIQQYDLIPEHCVFIDDLQRNLDGAVAFGIQTILFETKEQVAHELGTLGITLKK